MRDPADVLEVDQATGAVAGDRQPRQAVDARARAVDDGVRRSQRGRAPGRRAAPPRGARAATTPARAIDAAVGSGTPTVPALRDERVLALTPLEQHRIAEVAHVGRRSHSREACGTAPGAARAGVRRRAQNERRNARARHRPGNREHRLRRRPQRRLAPSGPRPGRDRDAPGGARSSAGWPRSTRASASCSTRTGPTRWRSRSCTSAPTCGPRSRSDRPAAWCCWPPASAACPRAPTPPSRSRARSAATGAPTRTRSRGWWPGCSGWRRRRRPTTPPTRWRWRSAISTGRR